jgi:type 1 glutamine amidotransferase
MRCLRIDRYYRPLLFSLLLSPILFVCLFQSLAEPLLADDQTSPTKSGIADDVPSTVLQALTQRAAGSWGRGRQLFRAQLSSFVLSQNPFRQLTDGQQVDLLKFLLTPPPSMPTDAPIEAPPVRTAQEVAEALKGSQPMVGPLKRLKLILIDGIKDHGPGEHDYPAWQRVWSELLAGASEVEIETVRDFPEDRQLESADVLIFFQKGSFSFKREVALDKFLQRGGGVVMIHWAVNGSDRVQEFSKRIGLASWGGRISYRHGPLTLNVVEPQHAIMRNFQRLELYDESYWKLTGDLSQITVLATSHEEGQATPQIWLRDHQPGRVFVSIPGHYSWTFDDPLFRILLLRGIAWTADQPIDRFNELVIPGARMTQ